MQTALYRGYAPSRPVKAGIDGLIRWLVFLAIPMLFLLSAPLLTRLGWAFSDDSGPTYQKFHPLTYFAALAAFIALLSFHARYWEVVYSRRWGFVPISAVLLCVYAVYINAASSGANGTIGLAITTFLTPALLLISIQALSRKDWMWIGLILRGLVIVNSVVGIVERLTYTSLVYQQEGYLWRSGGIFGHPLQSSLLTGMMLVYLLSAANRRSSLASVMPEVCLHAVAMSTFASRGGLLLAPVVIAIATLLPSGRSGHRISLGRRAAVVMTIVLAVGLSQLPFDFIQTALLRFIHDSGSSDTRTAALEMLQSLNLRTLLWGASYAVRLTLQARFGTPGAIEICWVALILSFGLVFLLPMVAGFATAIVTIVKKLDRSAMIIAIYFLLTISGSSSIGSKSLLIADLIIFLLALCQPRLTPREAAVPRLWNGATPVSLAR